jgi:lipopolysaccharide biosynthesis glycosyltransferase
MEVLFCFDQRYEQHFGAAVTSLAINNPHALTTVHIMVDRLSDRLQSKLDQLTQTYGVTIRTYEIDLAQVKGVKLSGHISAAAYYRILAAEFLPPETQKVLYLDSDLIVTGSIADLYKLDLADYPLAACGQRVVTTKKRLELNGNTYFNSGVILMNLAAWRQDDIGQKALQFIRDFPQMIKFHDQDALNKIVDGNFINLDKKWNSLVDLYAGTSQVTTASVMVHFVGSLKPWQYWCIHPDRKIYWSYLRRSPWSKAAPQLPKDPRQTLSAVRSLWHQMRTKVA